MASYECPYCNKRSDYEQFSSFFDGQEIEEICIYCDEPITIHVDLLIMLEAKKRVEND